jgi:PilZ domain
MLSNPPMHVPHALRRACLSLLGRRRHTRAPSSVSVDWHAFGSAVHHRSATEDLSSSGARLSSATPMPIGSPLVVALATEEGRVEVHARVAWSNPTRMGVRFTRPVGALVSRSIDDAELFLA